MARAGGAHDRAHSLRFVALQRAHDEDTDGDELSVQDRAPGDVLEAVGEEVFGSFFETGVSERVAPTGDLPVLFHESPQALIGCGLHHGRDRFQLGDRSERERRCVVVPRVIRYPARDRELPVEEGGVAGEHVADSRDDKCARRAADEIEVDVHHRRARVAFVVNAGAVSESDGSGEARVDRRQARHLVQPDAPAPVDPLRRVHRTAAAEADDRRRVGKLAHE